MLNNRYKNGLNSTPKSRLVDKKGPFLNERNLALLGLVFSLTVISSKIFYENSETLQKLFFERKLITHQVITKNGQIMFTNTWETAVRYSSMWLPLFCGVFATFFTWMCVKFDSYEPGINPPSPLSPKKYREESGHTFHINYLFSVLVGLLSTSYMYYKGISIQY
ncbi:unnamed protein product [Ceutorhynchus assimilis]|uniref:Uncharacterized protein n=1 Tax=Ceutorhynchus assimilis TaxID=467358 RepID=A0A9N9MZC3_9CUCU|nr:unnamed protein product [Ceutorhynchus assimilis]